MQRRSAIPFTLSLAGQAVSVHAQLRRSGQRWAATVTGSCVATAIAASPAAALRAALAPLGERAVTALLADVGLLEPSLRVLAVEREAG